MPFGLAQAACRRGGGWVGDDAATGAGATSEILAIVGASGRTAIVGAAVTDGDSWAAAADVLVTVCSSAGIAGCAGVACVHHQACTMP
jgi:hypothetical protein